MADRKDRFALINRFQAQYKIKDLPVPQINKYNEQWAADALIESFDIVDIYNVMEYYFSIQPRPTWKGFANNVDRLIQSKKDREEDNKLRTERREMAREWMSG